MKEEQVRIRVTDTTKRDFKDALENNGNYMTGVLMLCIDAYINKPQETISALKSLKKG